MFWNQHLNRQRLAAVSFFNFLKFLWPKQASWLSSIDVVYSTFKNQNLVFDYLNFFQGFERAFLKHTLEIEDHPSLLGSVQEFDFNL